MQDFVHKVLLCDHEPHMHTFELMTSIKRMWWTIMIFDEKNMILI